MMLGQSRKTILAANVVKCQGKATSLTDLSCTDVRIQMVKMMS